VTLPAVVGELVAKWREDAARLRADRDEPEATSLVRCTLTNCADQLAQSLSALTAEAGKGELADLVAKLPSLKTLDAVDDDLRRGTRPCPLNNLTISDVKLLHRALSTATPAVEWLEDAIDALEKAQVALRMSKYEGETWTDRESPLYEIGLVLAASPRGASVGESDNG
jgi:hypothetical protein